MIEVANLRDKAILSVLWSGVRLGELWNLKPSDITWDQHGCTISVFGKTGHRIVRVELWEYLKNWTENRKSRSKYLWTALDNYWKGKRLSKKGIRKSLIRLAKKSQINKPINPHNFRHSSATHLCKLGLNDIQLRIYFGWSRDSKMPSLYSHLSARDVDSKLVSIFNHKVRESDDVHAM